MRAVVLGAGGFIGGHLVVKLKSLIVFDPQDGHLFGKINFILFLSLF